MKVIFAALVKRLLFIVATFLLLSTELNADLDLSSLMGATQTKTQIITNPKYFFSAKLPDYFQCKINNDNNLLCDLGNNAHESYLVIKLQKVSTNASLPLVAFNLIEQAEKKANFKLLVNKSTKAKGSKARFVIFTYNYMGNVLNPRQEEIIIFVKNSTLYNISIVCANKSCLTGANSLETIVNNLQLPNFDKNNNPIKSSLIREKPNVEDSSYNLSDILDQLKGSEL